MASLWKRENSRYWIGCFTSPDGRQLKRSTKTGDRKLALKIVTAWEEAADRKITQSQARRVVAAIYTMISGDHLPSTKVRDFFNSWLEQKKIEIGTRTFDKYKSVALQFLDSLGERAEIDLVHLTSKDVVDFRDELVGRLTPTTANLSVKLIRGALRQAKMDGLVDENVAERVKRIAGRAETTRRAFTLPELNRILSVADDEWRGMIYFGLYTGQRLRDIALLTWQNLDLEWNELRLVTTKTGRQQIIPLAPPLRRFVEGMKVTEDPKQPLFPRARGVVEKTGLVGALSAQFYELMSDVGLVKPRTHKKSGKGRSVKRVKNEISFHCLRHTATSLMKNAGISPAIVQDIIGHDSEAISANYTHIDESAKRAALNAIPDVEALRKAGDGLHNTTALPE